MFKMKKSSPGLARLATVAASVLIALPAGAVTVADYMIIGTGVGSLGDTLNMQDSELGAISAESGALRFNNVSPPQGYRAYPGTATGYPTTGVITRDGDVAITSATGKATLSNTDIHSLGTGLGSRGIDCANTFSGCRTNGISTGTFGAGGSASGFNTTALPSGPSFTQVAENNGYQGSVGFTALLAELGTLRSSYWSLASTDQLNLTSTGGQIQSQDRTLTYGSGLHVIDIVTGGSDFKLDNANLIVNGNADTFVIFRVQQDSNFLSSNSSLLLAGNIGLSNVLFLVDGKQGAESFNFSNTTFYGYSFWDYLGRYSDNEASWNNVRGCGQLVTDQITFNNVSMTSCAYAAPPPTNVPEPGTLALLGLGLAGLVWRRRRLAA
jgi:hypothetical protein